MERPVAALRGGLRRRTAIPRGSDLKEVGPGQTQLLWKERYSDLIFYPHQLSDGSIRFICLAALLLQPNPPATVIIDESELGLHPYALELIAGLFREAAARCQLIISTQSRPLVDELAPKDLIVVDRKDGETQFSRPDSVQDQLDTPDPSPPGSRPPSNQRPGGPAFSRF